MKEYEEVKLGTRGSRLAIIQSEYVKRGILTQNPNIKVRLEIIKTTADRFTSAPLYRIGGKGLFLKEIEEALLEGRIDLAVHSMKDVPGEIPRALKIGAITERADPRDALISKEAIASIKELPRRARVGTSSLRRGSQLLYIRPDLEILPIRGNQDTRLKKLKTENLDAVVLAMAGLERMHFQDIHLLPLDPDICLPAGGQGSLGIEIREDDTVIQNLVRPLAHPEASCCIRAERACLHFLGAECYTSMAAYAEILNSRIHLRALVSDLKGERLIREAINGDPENPESLGSQLAERLLSNGAAEIIEEIKRDTSISH